MGDRHLDLRDPPSCDREMPPAIEFSADPSRLDRDRVHAWLAEESYWATGRTRETHDVAIDGSRNYGVYDTVTGEQLAYARVITDGVTFAWLCDVFVANEARGCGIGIALIEGVVDELAPLGLKRIALTTADAHGLYERFGFRPLGQPEQWMARMGAASR
jgi:GNAT superfamily N-acetyltransferase